MLITNRTWCLSLLLGILAVVSLHALDVRDTLRLANGQTPISHLQSPSSRAVPLLAAATPEEAAAGLRARAVDWFNLHLLPLLMKLAMVVATARLILKPLVEFIARIKNGEKFDFSWSALLNWLLSINPQRLK